MRINYILDPHVNSAVFINTIGESQDMSARTLLDLILRADGASLVEGREAVYRIMPLNDISKLPPRINAGHSPKAGETLLNLVFLKHMSAEHIALHLLEFTSEGATVIPYAPASLLLITTRSPAIR